MFINPACYWSQPMPKPIESTGNILTIEAREADAVKHIIEKLQRIERELLTLRHLAAAERCNAAVWCLTPEL